MPDKEVQILFRGTRAYRKTLKGAALARGITLQQLLEEAVKGYLDPERSVSTPLFEATTITTTPRTARVLAALRDLIENPSDEEEARLVAWIELKMRNRLEKKQREGDTNNDEESGSGS